MVDVSKISGDSAYIKKVVDACEKDGIKKTNEKLGELTKSIDDVWTKAVNNENGTMTFSNDFPTVDGVDMSKSTDDQKLEAVGKWNVAANVMNRYLLYQNKLQMEKGNSEANKNFFDSLSPDSASLFRDIKGGADSKMLQKRRERSFTDVVYQVSHDDNGFRKDMTEINIPIEDVGDFFNYGTSANIARTKSLVAVSASGNLTDGIVAAQGDAIPTANTYITGTQATGATGLIAYPTLETGITSLYRKENSILDLVPVGTMTQPAGVYIIETRFGSLTDATGTGTTLAERRDRRRRRHGGSARIRTEGAVMAEETVNFERRTYAATMLGISIPVTEEQLEDAGQMRQHLETILPQALRNELEIQILAGTGAGGDMRGITNLGNILNAGDIENVTYDPEEANGLLTDNSVYLEGFTGTPNADNRSKLADGTNAQATTANAITVPDVEITLPDVIFRAQRALTVTTRRLGAPSNATGVIMNASDWTTLRLMKITDASGNTLGYVFGGPNEAQNGFNLWGRPVVQNESIFPGEIITGDFTQCTLNFLRGIRIGITDAHDKNFTQNILVLKATVRAAFIVRREDAFMHFNWKDEELGAFDS